MKTIGRLTVVLTAILVIAFAAVTASAADFCTAGSAVQGPVIVDTTQAYRLLNSYRKQYSRHVDKSRQLGTLRRDSHLEKAASIRAREMAETGKFSHIRPNGKRGISLVRGSKAKGENIAKGYDTCEEVSAAWYDSPGHRENMLRKKFKKVGIAGYTFNGVTYWAQIYSS